MNTHTNGATQRHARSYTRSTANLSRLPGSMIISQLLSATELRRIVAEMVD